MAEVVVRMEERTEEMATEINNVILYGLYKGMNKTLGSGAKAIGTPVGDEVLKLMMDKYGLDFEGSDDPQELLNRFTRVMIETFGFAKKGSIEVSGNEITLKLEEPMDLPVLEMLKEEGITPVIYPMANAIVSAVRKFSGKKVLLKMISFEGKHVTVKMKMLG